MRPQYYLVFRFHSPAMVSGGQPNFSLAAINHDKGVHLHELKGVKELESSTFYPPDV